VVATEPEFSMKILTMFLAGAALVALSNAAVGQTGGMSGGASGGGPATGGPGQFPRPSGVETRGSGPTGSAVTGRTPDANRSDNDQIPGSRRPPVSPGNAGGSGIAPGADSSTPAPIIAPPSPFGAR
jgi:hypothetical protein